MRLVLAFALLPLVVSQYYDDYYPYYTPSYYTPSYYAPSYASYVEPNYYRPSYYLVQRSGRGSKKAQGWGGWGQQQQGWGWGDGGWWYIRDRWGGCKHGTWGGPPSGGLEREHYLGGACGHLGGHFNRKGGGGHHGVQHGGNRGWGQQRPVGWGWGGGYGNGGGNRGGWW